MAQNDLSQAHAAQESLQRERERLTWQIGEVEKLAPGPTSGPSSTRSMAACPTRKPFWMPRTAPRWRWMTMMAARCVRFTAPAKRYNNRSTLSPISEADRGFVFKSAQVEDTVHSLRAYLRKTELTRNAWVNSTSAWLCGCHWPDATSEPRRVARFAGLLETGTRQTERCR